MKHADPRHQSTDGIENTFGAVLLQLIFYNILHKEHFHEISRTSD